MDKAFDVWEAAIWEKIKEHRFMIVDALHRADDGLTEEKLGVDQWSYAYVQCKRAADEMGRLVALVRRVRVRRLDAASVPRASQQVD